MLDYMSEKKRNVSILSIGFAKWRGSDPRALAQAFRAQGHYLIEIDAEDYVPWRWNGLVSRVFRRLFLNSLVNDYNSDIIKIANSSIFDFILIFKGMYLRAETVSALRALGKPIYNFYPDVSFKDHGTFIPSALQYYDCVFTTKSFHGLKEIAEFKIKDLIPVRHGFDPEVHRPVHLSAAQMTRYGCDISFVGCWSPEKERLISFIINNRKTYKVFVYGIGWKYAATKFKKSLGGNLRSGVFGDELAIVYNASTINLGLLSAAAGDASMVDQSTVRSFQIPASRSLALHEDTPEIRSYFRPEEEIMLFKGREELLLKLDKLLSDAALRDSIKQNGYKRCLIAPYDYSSAVSAIVDRFEAEIH